MTRHDHIDKVTPTIIDSREVGFFWTRSTNQDTASKNNLERAGEIQRLYSKLNREGFVSDGLVKELFPSIKDFLEDVEGEGSECGDSSTYLIDDCVLQLDLGPGGYIIKPVGSEDVSDGLDVAILSFGLKEVFPGAIDGCIIPLSNNSKYGYYSIAKGNGSRYMNPIFIDIPVNVFCDRVVVYLKNKVSEKSLSKIIIERLYC